MRGPTSPRFRCSALRSASLSACSAAVPGSVVRRPSASWNTSPLSSASSCCRPLCFGVVTTAEVPRTLTSKTTPPPPSLAVGQVGERHRTVGTGAVRQAVAAGGDEFLEPSTDRLQVADLLVDLGDLRSHPALQVRGGMPATVGIDDAITPLLTPADRPKPPLPAPERRARRGSRPEPRRPTSRPRQPANEPG